MLSAFGFTHPCRVWRDRLTQRHDLSFLRNAQDIYGVDKWCRLMPSEAELLPLPGMGELGMVGHPANIWFPRGLDVSEGYMIQVKKPRVINGEREAIAGELVSVAAIDDVVLDLDTVTGFESGDEVTVDDGTNDQRVRIKTVSGRRLTLYAECELKFAFAIGTDVTADTFYKIISVMTPHGVGPIIETQAIAIPHTDID